MCNKLTVIFLVILQNLNEIITSRLSRAHDILQEHKDNLDLLAQTLIKEETLDDSQIRALLGFEQRQRTVEENSTEEI